MEEKKEQQQKENLTTMESQEQPDQLIVLSNSVTFALIGASNTMISSGVSAKEVYDVIFGLLGIKRDHPYKMGDLIKDLREKNIKILYVGKIKMPSGDIDFSIRDEFTSGFRQRFLENVLFEDETEKQNFENILKIIDDTVTLNDVAIQPSENQGEPRSYISLFGSVEDTPESTRVLTLEIPY
jgi:hypothetical protein